MWGWMREWRPAQGEHRRLPQAIYETARAGSFFGGQGQACVPVAQLRRNFLTRIKLVLPNVAASVIGTAVSTVATPAVYESLRHVVCEYGKSTATTPLSRCTRSAITLADRVGLKSRRHQIATNENHAERNHRNVRNGNDSEQPDARTVSLSPKSKMRLLRSFETCTPPHPSLPAHSPRGLQTCGSRSLTPHPPPASTRHRCGA